VIPSDAATAWGHGGIKERFRIVVDQLTAWPAGGEAFWVALASACGVPKFGARPRNQRFAGRTLISAPHAHLRARPRRLAARGPGGQLVDDDAEALLDPAVSPGGRGVRWDHADTRVADAEHVLGEREAGAQGRVGDNEVTTSEASLSAPSARLGRESHRDSNEVAAPTNGRSLAEKIQPGGGGTNGVFWNLVAESRAMH